MTRIEKMIWPFATVVSVALVGLAVLAAGDALGLDDGIVQWAQGILMAIAAGAGAILVQLFAIDRNRNGIPDIVERLLVWLGLLDDDPAPRVSGRRRRETIRPPDEGSGLGGAGLVLLGLGLAAATGTTGCGPSALKMNALVAGALSAVHLEASPRIREQRRVAQIEAAQAVHDAGGEQTAAEAAAAAVRARWRCAIEGSNEFRSGVDDYARELELANLGETGFTLERGLSFVRSILRTYQSVQRCLVALEHEDVLPGLGGLSAVVPAPWRVLLGLPAPPPPGGGQDPAEGSAR